MITEEQIKNIKPGDILYLNNYPITFQTSNIHGHVFAHDNVAECGEGCACWFSNKYLSLTSAETAPKYDPCRLFKKGDKVRVVDWNGRTTNHKGEIGEVTEDELGGRVTFSVGSHTFKRCYPICFLELVTPVEEIEPYSVETCQYGYTVNKGELILATYNDETHPHAKEAAEAERDRLNAEYRKEHA